MKKTAFLAMTAMLLLALALPICAQEFPDVPPDHWAYDAVQTLVSAGIVQGYPDGTYGGKRAMTRYEFAEALAKAIPAIEARIKANLPAGGTGVGQQGPAGPAGPAGVTPEELAALRRLVDEFRDELAAMGVDVEALRRDVAALNERVTALEEEVNRVRFSGEANLIGFGEVANSIATPFDRDSRALGDLATNPADRDNPLSNSQFFVDFDLGVKAKVSNTAAINAVINAGDYLPYALNTTTAAAGLNSGFDFTLWNLYADAGVKLGPLGNAQVVVGRFPFQLTPYTLKFVDPDSYTYVTKLDAGDYLFDGGRVSFNVGGLALTAFAAKTGNVADLITPDVQFAIPTVGAVDFEAAQLGGARAVIGTPLNGNLGLTYVQSGYNIGRSQNWGADLSAKLGPVGLSGEWAQFDPNDEVEAAVSTAVGGPADLGSDNTAWNAKLAFQTGGLALAGGYSVVEQNYFAPGYWSRLGRAVNLANVKGPMANLTYAFSPRLSFSAEGQFLEPNADDAGDIVLGRTAIDQNFGSVALAAAALDKVTYWRAGIKFGLTSTNAVDLGWEEAQWSPTTGDDTKERYISLGLGHSFNPNSSLKLMYQIVSYEQGALSPYFNTDDYRGGRAAAQFQFKF